MPQESGCFNKQELKRIAEYEQYGYKTANLMVLAQVLRTAPNARYYSVPSFLGIADSTIKQLLLTAGCNITEQWKNIIATAASPAEQALMRNAEELSPTFIAATETLRLELLNTLTNPKFFIALPSSIENFITQADANDWVLMVRSTGKEDTEECINAGGNQSIPNVQPNRLHVLNALAQVITSYLSPKSLQQRLLSHDATLFEEPFMPVLLQRMIGEQQSETSSSKEIPIGCVVYTREPLGNAKTILLLQATYGHTEGVVQSLVPLDSYYITKDAAYSIIAYKTGRIIPQNNELALVQNSPTLAQQPTLTDKQANHIATACRFLANWYGYPLDIELVFDRTTDIIHIVQARPCACMSRSNPSYITSLATVPPSDCLHGTIVNGAHSTVLSLTEPTTITAQTLDEALNLYLKLGSRKKTISAVVVRGNAEPTSHAAAILRAENIIIMTCDEINKLTQFLTSKEPLLLDPQRAVIVAAQSLATTQGLLNHPIAARITLPPMSTTVAKAPLWHNTYPQKSMEQLVEMLKEDSAYVATRAFNTLVYRIKEHRLLLEQECLSTLPELHHFYTERIHKLQRIESMALQLQPQLTAAYSLPSRCLERLFMVRLVEALLWQKEDPLYCDTFSYRSTLEKHEQLKTFINNILIPLMQKNRNLQDLLADQDYVQLAHDGYTRALTPELAERWLLFINGVATHGTHDQKDAFMSLINQIKKVELFTAYCNTSFNTHSQYLTRHPTATQITNCLATLHREYSKAEARLTRFYTLLESTKTLESTSWANPAAFTHNVTQLTTKLLDYFDSPELISDLRACARNSNKLLKLSALSTLRAVINKCDELIKTLKASNQYTSSAEKIEHFHTLLTHYAKLLKTIRTDSDAFKAIKYKLYHYDSNNDLELINSPDFNVSLVVQQTTSTKSFDLRDFKQTINTLEDVFTSIHQLLLHSMSRKLIKWKLNKILEYPDAIKQHIAAFELGNALTGITIYEDHIQYDFNKSLRAHSIGFTLRYYVATQQADISLQFYGDNEFLRWNIINDCVQALSKAASIKLKNCLYDTYTMTINWHLEPQTNPALLTELITNIIDISLELGIENRATLYTSLTTISMVMWAQFRSFYPSDNAACRALNDIMQEAGSSFNSLMIPALKYIADSEPFKKQWLQTIITRAETICATKNNDNTMLAFFMIQSILKYGTKNTKPWPKKHFKNAKHMRQTMHHLIKQAQDAVDQYHCETLNKRSFWNYFFGN